MAWRALIIPVLAGAGLCLAACGGGTTTSLDAHWYRAGYNFGVAIEQHGSPSVQADSPTQFCNAALGTLNPADGGPATYRTSDGTKVPRNAPPVSDYMADSAWDAGCVAGLTNE
jgi:hypothetical protein